MNKVIQVGAVVIINYDNYWRILEQIKKSEDILSRGLGLKGEISETPFALSVNKRCGYVCETHDDEKYLNEMKEAVKLFEENYPIKIISNKEESEFISDFGYKPTEENGGYKHIISNRGRK